jgi:hypothetical protein
MLLSLRHFTQNPRKCYAHYKFDMSPNHHPICLPGTTQCQPTSRSSALCIQRLTSSVTPVANGAPVAPVVAAVSPSSNNFLFCHQNQPQGLRRVQRGLTIVYIQMPFVSNHCSHDTMDILDPSSTPLPMMQLRSNRNNVSCTMSSPSASSHRRERFVSTSMKRQKALSAQKMYNDFLAIYGDQLTMHLDATSIHVFILSSPL